MVEKDTGESFDTFFSEFEEQPIGAASLAQVHRAVDRKSGQRVAVKVQHPSLDDWALLDLKLTAFIFNTLKRFFPEYDLTWLSSEMEVSLPQELNFVLEGKNARYAREYFSHVKNTPLVIPDGKDMLSFAAYAKTDVGNSALGKTPRGCNAIYHWTPH